MDRVSFLRFIRKLFTFSNQKLLLFLTTSFASFIFSVFAVVAMIAAFAPQLIVTEVAKLPFSTLINRNLGQVLQSSTKSTIPSLTGEISFNLPSIFNEDVLIDADATVSGTLTAPNILYGLVAGDNVTISQGQTPTISVALDAGTGLDIDDDGLLTNSDPGSAQNIFKNFKVGSSTIGAGSNTDTIEFVAGDNISLSADTTNKKITITGSAAGISGIELSEGGTTVTDAATILDFLGGDFDVTETPSGEGNIQLATTLTSVTGVSGAFTVGTDLIVGGDTINDFTGTNSGLEVAGGILTLITSCNDNEILKYTDATGWICATDAGGGGGGVTTIQTNEVSIGSSVDTLDFSTLFTLTASPANEVNITIAGDSIGDTQLAFNTGQDLTTTSTPAFTSLSLTSLIMSGDTINDFQGTGLSVSGNILSTTLGISVDLASAEVTGILALANGGTGQNITGTSITDGQILIGNNGSDGFSLSTLTAGTGISISNASGAITISQTGSGASKWTQSDALGILYPNVSTLDFLVGGTTSSSAKFAVLNVAGGTPTASVSGTTGSAFITSSGGFQTTDRQSVTIGGGNSGNIVLSGLSTGIIHSNASGVLSSSAVNLASSDVTGVLSVANGGTGANTFGGTNTLLYTTTTDTLASITTANNGVLITSAGGVPSISSTLPNAVQDTITRLGTVTVGTWNGSTVGSQWGGTGANLSAATQGSVPYFSATGVMSALAPTTAGFVLSTNGAGQNPSWIDAGNLGTNYWDRNNGVLSPKIAGVHDLLLGSEATTSAKFAFINVASGTPTASISAITTGNALSLDAGGNIFTTNKQSLTLGSASTGNIFIGNNGFTTCSALETIAGVLTCGTDDVGSAGTNYWQLVNGAISPFSETLDVLVGSTSTGSAEFALTGIAAGTPTATLSATTNGSGLSLTASTGTIQSLNFGTLTLGGDTTGNISIAPKSGTGTLALTANVLTINGSPGITSVSPTCVSFTNGIVTGSSACGAGAGGSVWTMNTTNGTLYPINSTLDLLIGGVATTSARFALTGIAAGTPIATLSASTNNAGLYFDAANSTIQSVRNNTLNFGGNTTGNITLSPLNGQGVTRINAQNTIIQSTVDSTNAFRVMDDSGNDVILRVNTVAGQQAVIVGGPNTNASGGRLYFGETNVFLGENGANDSDALALGGLNGVLVQSGNIQSAFQVQNEASAGLFTIGTTGTNAIATIGARTSFASLVVDNSLGDLFTASSSGLERFTIKQNGTIQLSSSMYPTCTALETVNGLLTCGTDDTGSGDGSSNWTLDTALGVLRPNNNTVDLLIGGTSSSSARFHVYGSANLAGTTPVASISGNTIQAGLIVDNRIGDLFTASSSGLNRFVIKQNGQVGIGTNTPAASRDLEIATNRITSYMKFNPTTSDDWTIGADDLGFVIYDDTVGGSPGYRMTIDASGRMVIGGQVTPTDTLIVSSGGTVIGRDSHRIITNGLTVRAGATDQHVAEFFGQSADYAGFLVAAELANSVPFLQFADNAGSSGALANGVDWTMTSENSLFHFRGGNAVATSIMSLSNTGSVGIGASTHRATLDVRGNSTNGGTTPIASLSANTAFAGLVVDNSLGDLFSASSSGLNRFVIRNNGNVGIGTALPTTPLDVVGIINASSDITVAGTSVCLESGANCPDSGVNYWDLLGNTLSPTNAETYDFLLGSKATSSAEFAVTGIAGGTPTASLSATTNSNGLSLNASAARFQSLNMNSLNVGGDTTGNIILSGRNGSSNSIYFQGYNCSGSNGGALTVTSTGLVTCTDDDAGAGGGITTIQENDSDAVTGAETIDFLGSDFIVGANGTEGEISIDYGNSGITRRNNAEVIGGQWSFLADILAGGTSTASARFAVLNMMGAGTPTATLSAGAAGGIYLTAAGSLQTTTNQTLTFGGNTTGNLVFSPLNSTGFSSFNGGLGVNTTNLLGTLDVRANLINGGTIPVASLSGRTSFASLVVDNSDRGDIFAASSSGLSRFTVKQTGDVRIETDGSTLYFGSAGDVDTRIGEDATNDRLALFGRTGINLVTNNGSGGVTINQNGGVTINTDQDSSGGFTLNLQSAGAMLFADTNSRRVGIGVAATGRLGATLDVSPSSATIAIASFSGSTNFAGLVVDNTGAGDLFTASSSGLNRFVIKQNGQVGIGTTLPLATLDVNGTASLSSSLTFRGGAATIQATQNSPLTFGGNTGTGEIIFAPAGSTAMRLDTFGSMHVGTDINIGRYLGVGISASSGEQIRVSTFDNNTVGISISGSNNQIANLFNVNPTFGNLQAWFDESANLRIGGSAIDAGKLNVTGDDGGKALVMLNQTGVTDILAASVAGVSKFVIKNDGTASSAAGFTIDGAGTIQSTNKQSLTLGSASTGNILLGNTGFTSCGALTTVASVLTCSSAGTSSNWTTANGAIYPNITTQDLLIGGISSSSALFRVTGNDRLAGTKSVASVSANTSFAGLVIDNRGSGDLFTASSSGLNRFVIKQDGKVGIGTTLPTKLLVVGSGTDAFQSGTDGMGINSNNDAGFIIRNSTSDTEGSFEVLNGAIRAGTGTSSPFDLMVAGTTVIRLDTNVNVGINTTSALAALDVRGNTLNALGGVRPTASISAQSSFASLIVDNRVGDIFTASSSGLNRFVIKQDGNVGIGTTTPLAKLHIKDTASIPTLGSENITLSDNRDFTTSTGSWTTSGTPAWKIDTANSNLAAKDAPGVGAITLANGALNSAPVAGTVYQISVLVTTTATSSGGLNVSIGGAFGADIGHGTSTSETYVVAITADDTSALILTPEERWFGTIDDVSIKQLTPATKVLVLESSDGAGNLEFRIGGTDNEDSIFIGEGSGAFNQGGTNNLALGSSALGANIDGLQNTAFGNSALSNNTSGSNNNAIGIFTLGQNTIGTGNNGVGAQALLRNTTGSNNSALGEAAGYYDNISNFEQLGTLNFTTALGAHAIVQQSNSLVLGRIGDGTMSLDTGQTRVSIGTTIPQNMFSVSPLFYNTGSAGQSGTTVTGSGTTWTSAMVGMQFIFETGEWGIIRAVNSTTSITLSTSQTVAVGSSYQIHHNGFQINTNGQIGIGTSTPVTTLDIRGHSQTLSVASISGVTNLASLVVDNSGTGNIFTASSSGLERFTIRQNGTIQLSTVPYLTCTALETVNGVLTCGTDEAGTGSTNWTTSTGVIRPNNNSADFLIGGVATSSAIFSVTGNNAGAGGLTPWATNSQTLPIALSRNSSAYANGYVYVIGGVNTSSAEQTAIYYAQVKADGSINRWVTNQNSLPLARLQSGVVIVNNYMYVIGGYDTETAGSPDGSVSTVYYARINPDGSVGAFSAAPALGAAFGHPATFTSNGYIYAMAGDNGGTPTTTVYYNKVNPDGSLVYSTWQTTSAIPAARAGASAVVTNGFVYLIGGYNGGAQSTVYFSKINQSNGTLGTWNTTQSLPGVRYTQTSVTANGYIYAIGGADGGDAGTATVYYTKPTADGFIVGTWSTNNLSLPANRAFHSTIAANGYIYVMGGGTTGSSATGTSTVYYASTSRVSMLASLDLIGLTNGSLSSASGELGFGSAGGSIFAGNIFSNANLEVVGATRLWGPTIINNALTATSLYLSDGVGTAPIASMSGHTAMAGLIVNNNGSGDIFTASSSGLARFTIKNNGNVGIGTENPTVQLQLHKIAGAELLLTRNDSSTTGDAILGGIGFDSNDGNVPGNILHAAAGIYGYAAEAHSTVDKGGYLTFNTNPLGQNDDTNNIERMRLTAAGKFGIATTTPLATLDVRGNITDGGTTSIASFSGRTSFATLSVDNTLGDLFTASSSGLNRFVIKNNGNVGIGTTLPTAVLDVAGTASVASTLTFRSGAGAIQTTANNTLTIGGASTGDINISPLNGSGYTFLTQAGFRSDAYNFYIGADTFDRFRFYEAINDSKIRITTNDSSSVSGLEIYHNGGNYYGAVGYNNGVMRLTGGDGGVGIPLSLGAGDVDFVRLTTSGTLGLNTTTPLGSLDISPNLAENTLAGTTPIATLSGRTSFASLVVDNSGRGDLFTASSSGLSRFTIRQNGSIQLSTDPYSSCGMLTTSSGLLTCSSAPAGGSSNWTLGSGVIYPNITTQDLLIGGISSSSALFRVTGDARLAGTKSVASVSANSSFAGLVVDNKGRGDLFAASSSGLNRFVIKQDGNVGIGTNVPAQSIHLLTNQNSASGLRLENTNSGSSAFAQMEFKNSIKQFNFGIGGINGSTANTFFVYDQTSGVSRIVLDDLGRVAIGPDHNNPRASLDLRATAATFSIASISGATNLGYASLVVDNSGAGNLFTASSSGLNRFVITQAGRVGIGTTVPSTALHLVSTDPTDAMTIRNNNVAGWSNINFQDSNGTSQLELGYANGSAVPAAFRTPFMYSNSSLSFFMNASTTLASLVMNGSGTTPVASVAASTTFAGMVVDNSGRGDLFAASSSGLNRFVIKQNGNIGIGTSLPESSLHIYNSATDKTSMLILQDTSNNEVPVLRFTGSPGADDQLYGQIEFKHDANSNTVANLKVMRENNANAGEFVFETSDDSFNLAERMRLDRFGRLGIGTSTPIGLLDVRTNLTTALGAGTLSVATISGRTSFASLVVDNSGRGDLFTASSSGLNRFVIKQNGYVGIGTTNPESQLHSYVATGGNILRVDSGSSQAEMFADGITVGFGALSNHPVSLYSNDVARIYLTNNGNIAMGATTTTPRATLDLRANVATYSIASISGATNAGWAGLVVDNSGAGDILTASSSGLSRFTIRQNGSIQLSTDPYNSCGMLTTSSGLLTCSSAPAGGSSNWTFDTALGVLRPNNSTVDLLIGGTSSSSARFHVYGSANLAGTTPVASISGNTIQSALIVDNRFGDLFTASSAGLSRFVIKQNGNVGIGTTLPVAALHIAPSAFGTDGLIATAAAGRTGVGVTGGTGGNNIITAGTGGNSNTLGGIGGVTTVNGGAGGFSTNGDGGAGGELILAGGIGGGTTNGTFAGVGGNVSLTGGDGGENDDISGTGANGGNVNIGAGDGGFGEIQSGDGGDVNINAGIGNTSGDINIGTTTAVNITFGNIATTFKVHASNAIGSCSTALITNSGTIECSASSGGSKWNLANGTISPINGSTVDLLIGGVSSSSARFHVFGSANLAGTTPVASISGNTIQSALIIDNRFGDLLTASSAGQTRFTVKQNGTVVIGSATSGITFDYLNGGVNANFYSGLARPQKQIVLSPEFSGAVLTASGSSSITGAMTSDASHSATPSTFNFSTYYEWAGNDQASLQDYTVAVRVTLPADFSSWAPGGSAMQVAFNTNLTTNDTSKLDVKVYNTSNGGLTSYFQAQTSTTAKNWRTVNISANDLNDGGSSAWNTASTSAMIYLKMYANDSNYIQVGDIILNYLSKF